MGVFDKQAEQSQAHTITIHRESWRNGEQVIARIKTTPEDEKWVTKQLLQHMTCTRQGLSTLNQFAIADSLWLQRLIVSWTLTKDGDVLPLDAQSLALLPLEERDFIVQRIFQKQPDKPIRTGLSRPRVARDFQSAVETRNKRFQQIES